MAALPKTGVSLVTLALAAGSLVGLKHAWSESSNEPDPPPPPANTEMASVMMRAGLDAPALAAAGLTANEVTTLVAAAVAQFNTNPSTLAGLDLAYAQARTSVDSLRRLVRSGQGSAEDVTALATAKQTLLSATNARTSYLDGLRSTGLAGVSASASATVDRILANGIWDLPTQYLVKDRTQAQWVDLREALSVEAIAAKYGEPFPQVTQSYLAGVNAESEIATAKVNLDTNLAAVQTAWNAGVTE